MKDLKIRDQGWEAIFIMPSPRITNRARFQFRAFIRELFWYAQWAEGAEPVPASAPPLLSLAAAASHCSGFN